jgi:hypothetical protein
MTVKKSLMLWVAAAALAMTGNTASAAFFTIDDFLETAPVVTHNLASATVTSTPEQVVASGQLTTANTTGFATPGARSVILLEPGADTEPFQTFSDFVTLTVGNVQEGPGGQPIQIVSIFFQSSEAPNFAANVANLPANTPRLFENGNFQDLSTLLNFGVNQLTVRSDAFVPEPGSLTLLGIGSVILIGCLRSRRKASAV